MVSFNMQRQEWRKKEAGVSKGGAEMESSVGATGLHAWTRALGCVGGCFGELGSAKSFSESTGAALKPRGNSEWVLFWKD